MRSRRSASKPASAGSVSGRRTVSAVVIGRDHRKRRRPRRRVRSPPVPARDGAMHCFVAATLTRSPRHPVGRLLGDALVLEASASGRSRARRIPFRTEDGMHLGGAHHLALLNHPAVYERLRAWLATPPLST